MEKFLALAEEKQKKIIGGAMQIFGGAPYKKASVGDIAKAAGISKGMVFYYFGSKKELYLFLMSFASQKIITAYLENPCSENPDFFERVRQAAEVKLGVLSEYPNMLRFLTAVFFERDAEVKAEVESFLANGEELRGRLAFPKIERQKFKEGVRPELVMNLIARYTEGYISHFGQGKTLETEAMMAEFDECLAMMRNNFYKEEYLR